MITRKIFTSLFLILTILPTAVFAQFTPQTFTPDGTHLGDLQISGQAYNIFQLIFGAGIPADVLNTNDVLQRLLFPFIAVWFIMYGILAELRIFTRTNWVQAVLALLIALISSASGALWYVVAFFFLTGGYLGTIMFGVLLIVGIFLWGAAKLWGWGIRGRHSGGMGMLLRRSREALDYDAQIQRREDELRRLRYAADAGIMDKLVAATEIQKILKEVDDLEKKKREITGDVKKDIERPRAGVA